MALRPPLAAPVVELYYAGAWHDISLDVSGKDGIAITRGRSGEAGQADPTTMRLTLRNPTGTYSPRNPNSPLYGLIGRGTPIRATVTYPPSAASVRFTGEVVEWPQRWGQTGSRSSLAPIECAGPLRKLGQGASPVRSAMYRGCSGLANLVGYWPMEDAPQAGYYAAVKGRPMRVTGNAVPGDAEPFIASAALPTIHRGYLSATIPTYTNTGQAQVRWLMQVPAGTVPDGAILMRVRTNSTLGWVDVLYRTGGSIETLTYTNQNVFSTSSGVIAFNVDGRLLRCSLELTQVGPDVQVSFATLEQGAAAGAVWTFTSLQNTLGSLAAVEILPKPQFWDLGATVIGHVTAQSAVTSLFDLSQQLRAYLWETPGNRIGRLATETGLASTIIGSDGAAARCGYQGRETVTDLLTEAADTGAGVLFEARASTGLVYRSVKSLAAQTPALALTYTDNLLIPFEPTDDDSALRNTVTVTRDGGAAATVTKTSGPLGTATVGTYDTAVTLSLAADEAAKHHAGWRVGLGTVDQARWPRIGLDLAHPTFLGSGSLRSAVLGLDVGDRLTVSNLPAWLPPVPVDALVQGYTEDITPGHHRITYNCSPYRPYRVGKYGTAGDRWGSSISQLRSAVTTTTATTIQVRRDPSGLVPWTENPAHMPFNIIVSGEVMTVTAVSTVGSTHQLFTVTRSVNGVAKTHAVGTQVELADPLTWGL